MSINRFDICTVELYQQQQQKLDNLIRVTKKTKEFGVLCVRVKYKTEKSQQDHIVSHKLFVITTPRHTQNSENPKDTDTVASPSKRSKKPNKKITRKSNGKKAFPKQYFSIQIFFCRPRRRWQRCRGGGGV